MLYSSVIMDSVDNSVIEYMDIINRMFHSEFIRRESLEFCEQKNINFSLNYAAMIGFYFVPNQGIDTLFCMHCGYGIGSWEPTDEIEIEHARHSPDCKHNGFNVPKKYQYLTQFMIDAWFDSYYHGKFQIIESISSIKKSAIMNEFLKLFYIRRNDPVYKDGIFNDLVALYSKDTVNPKDLTVEQVEEINEIIVYMDSSFVPKMQSSIVPKI